VVLGTGKALFGGVTAPTDLLLLSTTQLPFGVVKSMYRRGGDGAS